MMPISKTWFFLLTMIIVVGSALANSDKKDVNVVHFNGVDEFELAKDSPNTLEALTKDWGQFELLIPKINFPVAAPHCKGKVILRFVAIPPNDLSREERISARWSLLQNIRDFELGKTKELTIQFDLKNYVVRDLSGNVQLKYCNVFSDKP